MAKSSDLVVIGSGPGGYVAALRAAQLGMRVILVEDRYLGGVCLNVGCIPTKAILRTAEMLANFRRAQDFGLRVESAALDLPATRERRDKVVQQMVGGVRTLLKSAQVELIEGRGRLLSPSRVRVEGSTGGDSEEIDASKVIIATGSRPVVPPVPGADLPTLMDSDNAVALDEVPGRLLIIGGGPVGVEFANIYQEFGSKVTVVEMLPALVPNEDVEVSRLLQRSFRTRQIDVRVGTRLDQIEDIGGGALRATLSHDKGSDTVEADRVLMAVGRRPNSENLGLEEIGVTTDRGWIKVDAHRQTSVPGVYAIGDVVGPPLLAHKAMAEGVVAAEHAGGHPSLINLGVMPACVFTQPEIASVGLTEKAAQEAGYEVMTGKFPFAANGRAVSLSEPEGMVKIVAEASTQQVLGLHIIGHGASDLIVEGALAMTMEATLDEIEATIHAHPTSGEAIHEAALAAEGRPLHIARLRMRA